MTAGEMVAGPAPREIWRWRLGLAAGRLPGRLGVRGAWPLACMVAGRWDRWTLRLGVGVRGAWPLVAAGGEDERRPTPGESRRELETGRRVGKRVNLIKWRPTLDRAVSVPGQHEHGPQQRVGPGSTTG